MRDGVHGPSTPGIDTRPNLRSETVKNWKKSISCFLNTEAKWNAVSNTGNLTQSKKINGLIKSVIRHELETMEQKAKK